MHSYLADKSDRQRLGWTKRFRPALWSVDFARPMMAALTVPQVGTLRITLDFQTKSDIAGVIWSSEDVHSHPLLSYSTDRDYRGCTLSFDWAAGFGVMPLDALNGAVLTLEGRDAEGQSRTWYVRLWNYASGTPDNAHVVLDFSDLRAGFGEDGELVHTADLDRLFLSVVPQLFDGGGGALPASVRTFVELRNLVVEGVGSTLACGDAFLPEHQLRMSSGYDDSYHQAPERLVEQWLALGYREVVNHYVGMSHFPALAPAGEGRFEVSGGLCASAEAWHAALLNAIADADLSVILSLSFELFDDYAPSAWAQRDLDGKRALTGWSPPSTLISPCSGDGLNWLCGVAAELSALAAGSLGRCRFQIGEPWWWVGQSGLPCFYDAGTLSRWEIERGLPPPAMLDARGMRTSEECEWLDWLGERLSDATSAVMDAAREAAGGANFVSHLLFYAPQVLDPDSPDLKRANMPVGWGWPAFDVLQLEDYDHVTSGDTAAMKRAREAVANELGYATAAQHYLSGFVAQAELAKKEWPLIAAAAADAIARGVPSVFVWAWPQVSRDGFTWMQLGEGEAGEMDAFHDVRFPLALGFEAVGGPEFHTQISDLTSGHEQRNIQWAQARLSFDAGLGVRSEADLVELTKFFRARRGRAFAFRFRDEMDCTSSGPRDLPTATDQLLGLGDGKQMNFPLVKSYGEPGAAEVRRITRPIAESIKVAVGGVELLSGWAPLSGGQIQFEMAPAAGASVTAGYEFDVPVRFAQDRLDISLSGVLSGDVPSIPLVEVRE